MACRPIPLKPPCKFDGDVFEASLQFQNVWTPHLQDFLRGKKANPMTVQTPVKIAVVGAGPAGLVTAYELQKIPQAEIKIFERESRVGGRILTVGYRGSFDKTKKGREYWTNERTYGEAGGMRLPLPPEGYMLAKYPHHKDVNLRMSRLSDHEINLLLHGNSPYEFVEDSDFPMPLIRHYIKEMKIPVKRFNMNVAAADVNVQFGDETFEGLFVRKNDGKLHNKKGQTLEESSFEFLMDKTILEERAWLKKVEDNLCAHFDKCVATNVRRDLRALTNESWRAYNSAWNLTYRQCLTTGKNAKGECLGFEPWPEKIIEFYQDVFRVRMDAVICVSIIESDVGQWWQDSGMFCPKYGMHSIYAQPPPVRPDLDSPPGKNGPVSAMGLLERLGEKVELIYEQHVTRICRLASGKIDVTTAGQWRDHYMAFGDEEVEEFDAVVVTLPPDNLKQVEIEGFEGLPLLSSIQFPTQKANKNIYEFEEMFWQDFGSMRNKGDFCIDAQNGFLTRSRSGNNGNLSQLRYSTPDEGNIIMNYEFGQNALAACRDRDDGILDFIQSFHQNIDIKSRAVLKKGGKGAIGKYRAPWMDLSDVPYTEAHFDTLTGFCNYGDKDGQAKGLYFAGDGWSFKPQWQEGAFYTALHAVFRLINDFSGNNENDPFLY